MFGLLKLVIIIFFVNKIFLDELFKSNLLKIGVEKYKW